MTHSSKTVSARPGRSFSKHGRNSNLALHKGECAFRSLSFEGLGMPSYSGHAGMTIHERRSLRWVTRSQKLPKTQSPMFFWFGNAGTLHWGGDWRSVHKTSLHPHAPPSGSMSLPAKGHPGRSWKVFGFTNRRAKGRGGVRCEHGLRQLEDRYVVLRPDGSADMVSGRYSSGREKAEILVHRPAL